MMTKTCPDDFGISVDIFGPSVWGNTLVVCEHASNHIPAFLCGADVDEALCLSHVAWDPGAYELAVELTKLMNARLVYGKISRLVYDCNRPPEAGDAIPAQSEIYRIPFNQNLNTEERQARVDCVYEPFRHRLNREIQSNRAALKAMVTVHSFTPVYHGKKRGVEVGILHGADARLADAMMSTIPENCALDVRLNEPYGVQDGVTHTLDLHGAGNGLASVMIEIRNDLISTRADQEKMAQLLAPWIRTAQTHLNAHSDALS